MKKTILSLLSAVFLLPVCAEDTMPDYSQIVTHGEFTFALDETGDKAFEITSDLTGFPVALSSKEQNTYTTLNATFTVPEGQVGVLSWKGINFGAQPNGFNVWLDGERKLFNDCYHPDHIDTTTDWNADVVAGIPAGTHTVCISYLLQRASSCGYKGEQYGYFYGLSLQCQDVQADAAMLLDPKAELGSLYCDRFGARGNAQVRLLNLGSNPLRLAAATSEGYFAATDSEAEAATFETLNVNLAFAGAPEGQYNTTLPLATTAGEITVDCSAEVMPLPYDYSSIVTEGEFSFDTSEPYPFEVADEEAFSSNYVLGDTPGQGAGMSHSWLEVAFEVPEGKTGTLEWTGLNDSARLTEYLGSKVLSDGTIVTIDGEKAAEFAGFCDASSSKIDAEQLTFGEGRHYVRFSYQKKSMEPSGDDRFTLSELCLRLQTPVGVNGLKTTTSHPEYYDLMGRKHNAPSHGIYVCRQIDGLKKIIIKK